MNKDYLRVLLEDLYFDVNDAQLDFIYNEFMGIYSALTYLENVDTSNVEPADWPFKVSTNYLREDEVVDLSKKKKQFLWINFNFENITDLDDSSLEETLKNASSTQDEYVKYIKVV